MEMRPPRSRALPTGCNENWGERPAASRIAARSDIPNRGAMRSI